jgi:hypothetical protein
VRIIISFLTANIALCHLLCKAALLINQARTGNRPNGSVSAIRIQCRLTIIFDDEKRGKKPLWINIEEQDQTERTSFNHIIAIHNQQIIGTISNLCR